MESEMNYRFKGEVTFDLDTSREIDKGYHWFSPRVYIPKLVICITFAILCVTLNGLESTWLNSYAIALVSIFWIFWFFGWIKNKNGNLNYKRNLSNNGGKPPQNAYRFCDDRIHIINIDSNNQYTFQYNQILSLAQTKNHIILMVEHNQYLPIRKDSITGGSESQFIQFLVSVCPNLKPKHYRSNTPGKIIFIALIAVSVLLLLLSIYQTPFVQFLVNISRPVNNTMNLQQMATALEEYDIHVIDQLPEDIQKGYAAYQDYLFDHQISQQPYTKTIYVLSNGAQPVWDYEQFCALGPDAVPASESGVVRLDLESWNPETMYGDLLCMISSLDPAYLDYSHIMVDNSGIDPKNGLGIQVVTFSWDGYDYKLKGETGPDWYDLSILSKLNDIIGAAGRRLYFVYDETGGILIFFRDPIWASTFRSATGLPIKSNVLDLLKYIY